MVSSFTRTAFTTFQIQVNHPPELHSSFTKFRVIILPNYNKLLQNSGPSSTTTTFTIYQIQGHHPPALQSSPTKFRVIIHHNSIHHLPNSGSSSTRTIFTIYQIQGHHPPELHSPQTKFRVRKIFSTFYRCHYDLVSKFNTGLKSHLKQGLSESEFYGD